MTTTMCLIWVRAWLSRSLPAGALVAVSVGAAVAEEAGADVLWSHRANDLRRSATAHQQDSQDHEYRLLIFETYHTPFSKYFHSCETSHRTKDTKGYEKKTLYLRLAFVFESFLWPSVYGVAQSTRKMLNGGIRIGGGGPGSAPGLGHMPYW